MYIKRVARRSGYTVGFHYPLGWFGTLYSLSGESYLLRPSTVKHCRCLATHPEYVVLMFHFPPIAVKLLSLKLSGLTAIMQRVWCKTSSRANHLHQSPAVMRILCLQRLICRGHFWWMSVSRQIKRVAGRKDCSGWVAWQHWCFLSLMLIFFFIQNLVQIAT